MRTTTLCLIVAGLALPGLPAASAETTETSFEDPVGDAGPAGTELGDATANVDIAEVRLTSDEGASTEVAMELAAFDVAPPDTFYGVAFETDEAFVFAGYGHLVMPFPPFAHEGYFGCHVVDHEHDCAQLDGHELADAEGFQVSLVDEWTPANATLEHLSAAVYTDPYLPGDPAGEAVHDHVWPANAHDLAHSDAEHETPTPDDEATRPAELASTDDTPGSSGPSAPWLGAAAVALAVPAGVLVTRRR